MLFRKKIPRSCSYCRYGTNINDEQILCAKRALVDINHSCRKFRYDPLKRVPPKMKALNLQKYDDVDFTL